MITNYLANKRHALYHINFIDMDDRHTWYLPTKQINTFSSLLDKLTLYSFNFDKLEFQAWWSAFTPTGSQLNWLYRPETLRRRAKSHTLFSVITLPAFRIQKNKSKKPGLTEAHILNFEFKSLRSQFCFFFFCDGVRVASCIGRLQP